MHTAYADLPTHLHMPDRLAHTGRTSHFRHTLITLKHTTVLATGTHPRYTSPQVMMGKRKLRPDTSRATRAGGAGGLGVHPACTHKLVFYLLSCPLLHVWPCSGSTTQSEAPFPGPRARGGWHLPCGLLAICWQR